MVKNNKNLDHHTNHAICFASNNKRPIKRTATRCTDCHGDQFLLASIALGTTGHG